MIQDIFPSKLYNEFTDHKIEDDDVLLFFDDKGRVLLGDVTKDSIFITGAEAGNTKTVYLFSVDERRFFLALDYSERVRDGFSYYTIREVRDMLSGEEVYAVFTAYHLWKWYSDNVYCGKCGAELTLDNKERALRCPKCDNLVFPRINPAVIVGVINKDKLLVRKRQILISVLGHGNHILNAHAKSSRKIDSRLTGYHDSGHKLLLTLR